MGINNKLFVSRMIHKNTASATCHVNTLLQRENLKKYVFILLFGAQLSSRCFFDENATLLWKNGYKWMIQSIAHR